MKYKIILFTICCFIVSIQGSISEYLTRSHQRILPDSEISSNNNTDNQELHRTRRWTADAPAFCKRKSRYYSPVYHRRISEIKCYEYLWNISYDAFKIKKEEECSKYKPNLRVSEGTPVNDGDYPHIAAVGWRRTGTNKVIFLCGGTLISTNYVLTSAFCVLDTNKNDTLYKTPEFVRIGRRHMSLDTDTLGFGYWIKSNKIHPNYVRSKKYYDIALLELDEVVEFSENLQPACLWSYDNFGIMYDRLQMTGWGIKKGTGLEHDDSINGELLQGTVEVLDQIHCMETDKDWRHAHQLCVRGSDSSKPVSNCERDAGGPLQLKIPLTNTTKGYMHFVVGVIGDYKLCGDSRPRAHTRVSYVIDWIEKIVWPVPKALPSSKILKENLYFIPSILHPTEQLALVLFTSGLDALTMKFITDYSGPDYTNIAFELIIDFARHSFSAKVTENGVVTEIEDEMHLEPLDVINDNVIEFLTYRRENNNILDISIGASIIFSFYLRYDLADIRYFTLKGADVELYKMTLRRKIEYHN